MVRTKDTKTYILTNPVALFSETYQDATDDQIKTLSKLHQQYVELKTQLKEVQNQCKKISRQIGKAKREGLPTNILVQLMQEQSINTDKLKIQLKDIASNILSYFEPESNSQEKGSDSSIKPYSKLPLVRIHTEQAVSDIQVSIVLLSDEIDKWNRYVESNTAASLYQRAEWKNLIHNVFGHNCYYFYALNNNEEIVGILPLVRLKSRLFGDFMVSMPYFNYGGAIANSESIEQKLIQAANSHAKKTGSNHIEYRDDIAREDLPSRTEKVTMILSLPDSHHDLWNTFTSKLRSQIRRSQREVTRVNIGNAEILNDFYTVFAQNMRDLGTPVYSKLFFSKILQTFPEYSKIIVVRLENRPVAAAFLLGYNETLEIPWASTIKEVNHLSMNMLLYWEVLKFAIKNRYRYFDFGRSSKASGTFRFKQQWGAEPKQCYWHYWLSENAELPRLNPDNPKFALAIIIWKKIPISITKWLGPLIVKNLP